MGTWRIRRLPLSRIASREMSSCCPPGSEPPRAASPHVGEIKRFAQTDLYVAGPRSAKVASLRSRMSLVGTVGAKQDADRLGEKGDAVVIVDVTKGDWMRMEDDIDATMGPWLRRTDYDNLVKPSIDYAIAYLQQDTRVQQILSYGYCYGGWIGARLSTVSPPLIKGHASFHPSWVMEKMLHGEGAVEKMTESIKVPQLLLSASNDPDFVRTGGSVERILKANPEISSLSKVVDYEYVKHGWVNRGDLADEKVKAAVGDAWSVLTNSLRRLSNKLHHKTDMTMQTYSILCFVMMYSRFLLNSRSRKPVTMAFTVS